MYQLTENGNFVLQQDGAYYEKDTLQLEKNFLANYPTAQVTATNLSQRMTGFAATVLVNKEPSLRQEGYFALRPKVYELSQQEGLILSGWLLLDEAAGHEVYAEQRKDQLGEGFGRKPIVVFFEHTTKTVLVEGTKAKLTTHGTFA